MSSVLPQKLFYSCLPWNWLIFVCFFCDSICFIFPTWYKTFFDAFRTDVAFKLIHGHLSRGFWGKLFSYQLPDDTFAAQIADFSAKTWFFMCQGRLSTIYVVWEWTNVCRHFSVSRYAPCWVLNVWPVAWMACKSKRFTLLLPQFRIWQVGLAPAARGGGNPSGIEWYPRATPPVPCIVSSYTERKRRVAVIGDCLLRGMEGLMYRPETTTGKSAISQGLG